jgi:hypothetical protein
MTTTTETPGRGDLVKTSAGATGLYVGRLGACVWVAWDHADFEKMCAAFDAAMKPRAKRRRR